MTTCINFLLQPLQYEFMQRGRIAAILVGIVRAVVGTYVVLRGMAFFGDALAHTILPGIALSDLVSGGARDTLFWWALGTSIAAALVAVIPSPHSPSPNSVRRFGGNLRPERVKYLQPPSPHPPLSSPQRPCEVTNLIYS